MKSSLGAENKTESLSVSSPGSLSPNIQDVADNSGSRTFTPSPKDRPELQIPPTCIGFAGDSNVFAASLTAQVKDATPILSPGCSQATKSRTPPTASEPVQTVAPVSSCLGILTTPSVDSTPELKYTAKDVPEAVIKDVQHSPVAILFSKRSNIASSTTLGPGNGIQAKDAVDPVLPKATEDLQMIHTAPCPPPRPIMSIAPVVFSQNKDPKLQRRRSRVFLRLKDQQTAPNDVTSTNPAVAPSAPVDIETIPVRALVTTLNVLGERKHIVKNVVSRSSNAERINVPTPTRYLALAGEATVQSMSSDVIHDSLVASKFDRRSAPISLGYGSSVAPSQSRDNAKPGTNQDLTPPADLPHRSKKIRSVSSRSTFDRALQAIRDASSTLGDDLNCRAALAHPSRKTSSSLNGRDIQTSKSPRVSIPPRPNAAHLTGPQLLWDPDVNKNAVVVPEAPTQSLLITIPFDGALKPETFTKASSPRMAPSLALEHADVFDDKNFVSTQPPVFFGHGLPNTPSIALHVNHEPVTSITSHSRTNDALTTVKPGTRSRKLRIAASKTTSPSFIPINDSLSNIVTLPCLQDVLPNGTQQAPKAVDSLSPHPGAVVNNNVEDSAITPSTLNQSTIPTLEVVATGTVGFVSSRCRGQHRRLPVAPVCTDLASEVREVLAPVLAAVESCVLSSISPILVDEPICASSNLTPQNNPPPATYLSHGEVPPLPPFSASVATGFPSSPLSPSPHSMSSAAAPPPLVKEDHAPTMSSFTFVTDKGMSPVSNTDHEASPSSSSIWNTIDNASITPESNPWHDVRSMTPFSFRDVESPLIMPDLRPVDPQLISFSAQEPRVSRCYYSKLLLSPLPSPSSYRVEDVPAFTIPISYPTPAATSMEPMNQSLQIREAEMSDMMVVDGPTPSDICLDSTPATPAVIQKQSVPSASEACSEGTGFVPWKAPSLRKRIHPETMGSYTHPPPHRDRDGSQSPDPLEGRRQNKRLKCTKCVGRDVYEASSTWYKDRKKENEQRASKRRASKADSAQDWRRRRKPVLLNTIDSHAELCGGT